MTSRLPLPAWAAVIAVLTFAVFVPAYAYDYDRHAGFIWDDDDHYLNDHLVNTDDGWWRIWFDPQPGVVRSTDSAWVWNYWPLTRSSFWVDMHLFGTDESGRPNLFASHLVNVALHALNAFLLLVVLRRLRVPGAALAALFFAVHPVTVESVAWITERKNLLSTLFFLLALASWLRFTAGEGVRWYALSGGAFLLALMGKTSTVMFPVVLALLHWYERRPWTRRTALRLAPFFAMSLVAGVTSILFEKLFIDPGQPLPPAGFAERLAVSGRIAWFYLGKDLFPVGLAFNYPRWSIDPASAVSYLPVVAWVAVAAALWRFREAWARPWILGLACFLVTLFPVLGFLDLYGMRYAHVADHWQYLACIPVIAGLAALLASLPGRVAQVAVAVPVLAAFAALTWSHSGAFVDDETLLRRTLEQQPMSMLANNNVGTRRLREGRNAEAIPYLERAIEAGASHPAPYVNLGYALEQTTGSAEASVPYYERALEVEPTHPHALHFLAKERLARGRVDEAVALMRRAMEAHPTYLEGLLFLGEILKDQGQGEEVLRLVARASEPVEDKVVGGRTLMLGVWSAMAAALLGCAAVCRYEAKGPTRTLNRSGSSRAGRWAESRSR